MSTRLLTVEDVARLTGWHPMTVYKKSANGEIPGRITIGKNSLRFRAIDISEWLFGEQEAVADCDELEPID